MATTSKKSAEARKSETNVPTEMLRVGALISTWFNRVKPQKEKGGGPLLTVPDQTMSIREILKRFTKTGEMPPMRNGVNIDEDLTEFESLDRFEKMDLAKEIKQSIKDYQEGPLKNYKEKSKGKAPSDSAKEPDPGEASKDDQKKSEAKRSDSKKSQDD